MCNKLKTIEIKRSFDYGDVMTRWCIRLILLIMIIGIPTAHAGKKKHTAPSLPAAYHNNQGALYLSKGEFQKAEFEFKTAIELSPDYAEAYSNLGLVYKRMNRLDEALVNFRKATECNPNYASAYNHMGAVYLAQEKYDDAIKVLRKAIDKDRSFADAYYDLGLAYLGLYAQSGYKETGKRDQAEMLFKRATEINPKLVDVHVTLAQLYLDKGETEKAVIRQRLAVELDPGNIASWKKMGEIYTHAGDPEKARAAHSRAKELKEAPQKMATAQALGMAATEFQTGVQIMENGEKALAAKSTSTAKQYFAEAASHFQAAISADPKMWDAWYNLGLALFQGGDSDGAIKAWKELLKQNPNYLRAVYNIGMVSWRSGKVDDAKPYLCKFVKSGQADFAQEVAVLKAELAKNNVVCP